MALSEEQTRGYVRRLLLSRMRVLCRHGFYGLLLMHMRFAIDEEMETASTDGTFIYFCPAFLDTLSDSELDCVMLHELMHVVLQHCFRGNVVEQERYNIAADIVVNSNILLENNGDLRSITLRQYGVLMHLAPNGQEGHRYTAEEVFAMLPPIHPNRPISLPSNRCDEHSKWHAAMEEGTDSDMQQLLWKQRVADAARAMELRDHDGHGGLVPAFAQRMLEALRRPQIDWRTILQNFVQEEITDYSFSPPDRRFGDSDFFLPDFNEPEETVRDILFMIDTSGSMTDAMVTAAYSEIKGAIDQFGGRLQGWLGFFDAAVIPPEPFADVETFRRIAPKGGGGTSFHVIFDHVAQHMRDALPASIIILTDGYAPYPEESATLGVPVLWLLNNDEVEPPWGKVARMTVEALAAYDDER